ncbi:dihydrodipicolinate synthase family protein [Candidimonas sp. SYP-B2681]|uniref:dihydrodipicolinate synthase family protein n=1 Tax=Candidimonas sp. SYP-B2681 TaxID=2497686 RepID=UPI000F895EFD|nr:dihydrodipicolinate synthase family protein [Candidimonas sp. SYP-B2681]RTZ41578.1 dihydrodipicolinate synthase family protein [Candidimonas sp. SYP-B2681]
MTIGISNSLREAFTGISGILVTPFDANDKIAPTKLRPILDRAIEANVDIMVINGNTSEFYALQEAEAQAMMEAVTEMAAGRVPVVNGVGRSVHEACALARASKLAGVDAIMVHQPPDPFVSPRGLFDYVQRVADAADGLPVMLYLRNDAIGIDAIVRLTEIPAVAGVKWAAPSPMKLAQAIQRADPNIVWVGGLAETWAPALCAVGAQGFTSGLINIWPTQSVAILQALRINDYPGAMRLIRQIEEFETIRTEELNGTNVTGVKAALQLIGEDCGPTRPPAAWPLTAEQQERLQKLVRTWGINRSPSA